MNQTNARPRPEAKAVSAALRHIHEAISELESLAPDDAVRSATAGLVHARSFLVLRLEAKDLAQIESEVSRLTEREP